MMAATQQKARPDPGLPGPRVLVAGLGASGLSAARFLAGCGYEVAVADTRDQPPGLAALRAELPDVAVFTGGLDEAAFAQADAVVLSPGLSPAEPAVAAAAARGVPVVGDIEIFARVVAAPVAAITGSNGKSTVTALVGEMARAAGVEVRVGGNIGTPALDLLAGPPPALYVLELSSFQLETTASLRPQAAALLNVSPDHLDRYPDLAAYAAAKARIFTGCGTAVYNADDPVVRQLAAAAAPARRVPFTLGEPAAGGWGLREHRGETWLARGREPVLPAAKVALLGRHNLANALAALAVGEAAGLPRPAMVQALEHFTGLPHRAQRVAEAGGVTWVNDSKATNVGATAAALAGVAAGRVVLIAGGQGKGQDFSPLRRAAGDRLRALVLMGEDAPLLERALAGLAPVHHAGDMDEAVRLAAAAAEPGDTVLLSPACASFDQFRSFEERGERFVDAVRRMLR